MNIDSGTWVISRMGDPFEIGFVLGLFGRCAKGRFIFIILCWIKVYIHFGLSGIGFVWVCIGFVFAASEEMKISVIGCYK